MLFTFLEWNFKFMNMKEYNIKWNSVSNQWKSETVTLKNTDESFLSSIGWDLLNFVDVLVVHKKTCEIQF